MDSHLANLLRRSRQPHQRAAAANLKSSLEKKSMEQSLDKRLTPEQLSAIQAANSRAAGTTPATAATVSYQYIVLWYKLTPRLPLLGLRILLHQPVRQLKPSAESRQGSNPALLDLLQLLPQSSDLPPPMTSLLLYLPAAQSPPVLSLPALEPFPRPL
jgi:hypothetical protein